MKKVITPVQPVQEPIVQEPTISRSDIISDAKSFVDKTIMPVIEIDQIVKDLTISNKTGSLLINNNKDINFESNAVQKIIFPYKEIFTKHKFHYEKIDNALKSSDSRNSLKSEKFNSIVDELKSFINKLGVATELAAYFTEKLTELKLDETNYETNYEANKVEFIKIIDVFSQEITSKKVGIEKINIERMEYFVKTVDSFSNTNSLIEHKKPFIDAVKNIDRNNGYLCSITNNIEKNIDGKTFKKENKFEKWHESILKYDIAIFLIVFEILLFFITKQFYDYEMTGPMKTLKISTSVTIGVMIWLFVDKRKFYPIIFVPAFFIFYTLFAGEIFFKKMFINPHLLNNEIKEKNKLYELLGDTILSNNSTEFNFYYSAVLLVIFFLVLIFYSFLKKSKMLEKITLNKIQNGINNTITTTLDDSIRTNHFNGFNDKYIKYCADIRKINDFNSFTSRLSNIMESLSGIQNVFNEINRNYEENMDNLKNTKNKLDEFENQTRLNMYNQIEKLMEGLVTGFNLNDSHRISILNHINQ